MRVVIRILIIGSVFFVSSAYALSWQTTERQVRNRQTLRKQQRSGQRQQEQVEKKTGSEIKQKLLTQEEKTRSLKLRLDKLTQNIDNPRPVEYTLFDEHLGISGLVNVDANYKHKANFKKTNSSDLHIATAKFNFDLQANSWLSGHAGLFAATDKEKYYPTVTSKNRIDVDELYATIANFEKTPLYIRFGKQYLPFGNYHRYPINKLLTENLTETRALAAELGCLDLHGFYGIVYGLQGAKQINRLGTNRTRSYNGGAALGYINLHNPTGFEVGVSYLNNMADVGIIHDDLSANSFRSRVGAFSAFGDIISGPFDFALRYVTALRRFNVRDFAYMPNFNVLPKGAKPKAGSIKAGYKFKTKERDSELVVSYQRSYEAYNVSGNATSTSRLPRKRFALGYGINVCRHVILGCEITRDRDYQQKHGGTNRISHTATLRASAYF